MVKAACPDASQCSKSISQLDFGLDWTLPFRPDAAHRRPMNPKMKSTMTTAPTM